MNQDNINNELNDELEEEHDFANMTGGVRGKYAMVSPSPDDSRVTARLPASVKETLQRAADLTGATLNQFMVSAAVKEAQAIIEQQQMIGLSSEDGDKIFSLIEHPPKPNEELKSAIARHRAFFSETDCGTFSKKLQTIL